jgi:hypothetical protein
VGDSLDTVAAVDPVEAIARKKSSGSTGNLRLDIPRAQAAELTSWLAKEMAAKNAAISRLAGREVVLFRDPLG